MKNVARHYGMIVPADLIGVRLQMVPRKQRWTRRRFLTAGSLASLAMDRCRFFLMGLRSAELL